MMRKPLDVTSHLIREGLPLGGERHELRRQDGAPAIVVVVPDRAKRRGGRDRLAQKGLGPTRGSPVCVEEQVLGGFEVVVGQVGLQSRLQSRAASVDHGIPLPLHQPLDGVEDEALVSSASRCRTHPVAPLIAHGLAPKGLLADKGYDADFIRQDMEKRGGTAMIPHQAEPTGSTARPHSLNPPVDTPIWRRDLGKRLRRHSGPIEMLSTDSRCSHLRTVSR